MRRRQLAWLIERAARVTGDDDLIVVGSQAILASYNDTVLPRGTTMSIEADIAAFDDDDNQKADAIDWCLGEGSDIQAEHGIYAQGVSLSTPKVPKGWRDRLVPLSAPEPSDALGWCLEIHDLCVAKLVAGREKDLEFVDLAVTHRLADPLTMRARTALLDEPIHSVALTSSRIDRLHVEVLDEDRRRRWWRQREVALRERFYRACRASPPGVSTTRCGAPTRGVACDRLRADCHDPAHAAWRTTQPRE